MGKSTLEAWGDPSQLYGEFWMVMKKSGMLRATNCTNDPEMFFPDTKNTTALHADIRAAKKACKACPLLDACGTYALMAQEREGIWGSMTPNERQELRKEIVRQRGVDRFIKLGYLKYFRLRPKVAQLPRESRLIDE